MKKNTPINPYTSIQSSYTVTQFSPKIDEKKLLRERIEYWDNGRRLNSLGCSRNIDFSPQVLHERGNGGIYLQVFVGSFQILCFHW